MQTIIIQIIKDIQSCKQAANRVPNHPVIVEIKKELYKCFSRELESVESSGIIKTGDTINDKFIELNV